MASWWGYETEEAYEKDHVATRGLLKEMLELCAVPEVATLALPWAAAAETPQKGEKQRVWRILYDDGDKPCWRALPEWMYRYIEKEISERTSQWNAWSRIRASRERKGLPSFTPKQEHKYNEFLKGHTHKLCFDKVRHTLILYPHKLAASVLRRKGMVFCIDLTHDRLAFGALGGADAPHFHPHFFSN